METVNTVTRLPRVGERSWGPVLNAHLAGAAFNMSLDTDTLPTATSFDVDVAPPHLASGCLVAIDAGTVDCELRVVTRLSTNTVTVQPALERKHSSGAVVHVSVDSVVHPTMFGCKADNSTDDWQGLQVMFYQASKLIAHTIYGPIINGGGRTYRITKPLTFSKHTMVNTGFKAFTTFAPADENNAMMMSCSQNHQPFTATASDNTFAYAGSLVFPNLNEAILFNNMYGETLPGGLINGRVYYVKSRPDGQHITVSETVGGTEVELTSDGSGWAAGQIADLTKFWWKDIYISSAIADLNGLAFGSQQPADIYRLRVDMTVACSRATYGVAIVEAQIARLYNPEFVVNNATNVVALAIGVPFIRPLADIKVTGVHVQDANFDGSSAPGQTHILIGGGAVCDDIVLSGDTWLEGPGDAGIRLDRNVRKVDLGNLYLAGSPTNGAVHETPTAGNASWRVGQIFNSGSNHVVVKTVDGVLFKSNGSSDNVAADSSNVVHGVRRVSSATSALQLDGRRYVSTSTDITAAWAYETVDVDASAAGRIMTLPSAVGVRTFKFTIRKKDSSGNAVTVATTSSQTINGSTTYSLASQYDYVTVESDGANWMIVANN